MADNKYSFSFTPEILEKAKQKVQNHALFPVLSDIGFKLQLSKGTKASNFCLMSLLSAFTGQKVTQVQVLNAEITPEYFTAKSPRLDVYCVFSDGQKADIELQLSKEEDHERKRAVYYASKLYAGNLKKGSEYKDITNVYQIFLTDFTVFQDKKLIHNFQLREDDICLTESLQVIFAELSKVKYLKTQDFSTLKLAEFWCILYMCDRTSELYQKLRETAPFQEELHMFEESINEISQEEKAWAMQLSIEGGIIDYDSAIGRAERRGEERGEKRGKSEAKLEAALIAVKKFNLLPELVASEYGVPLERLQEALGK